MATGFVRDHAMILPDDATPKPDGIFGKDNYRRGAYFVDRNLRGEEPGDLPIEFPTKVELVINVAVAKALRLAIPPTLLARADEVIE